MSDISALEQRLAAALRRISTATEALPDNADRRTDVAGSDTNRASLENSEAMTAQAEFEKIQTELIETCKKLTAQERQLVELTQALEAARTAQSEPMPTPEERSDHLAEAVNALELELSQVSQSNAQLRASNKSLRDVNAQGVGDAGLINAGLQAEIDSLTAERAADAAQMQLLITALSDVGLTDAGEELQDA
jgi:septal ring factor EnvC (AmiA/AmiB activator)